MKPLNMELDVDTLIKGLAIQAEIEGMKAENKMREMNNDSMAYWSSDFDIKAEELRDLLVDEKPLMCDCHEIEGIHELGSSCCLKKIANPQPLLVSKTKGIESKHRAMDMFSINNKRYSRNELYGQSYQYRNREGEDIWICLKKWEIK